jgi:hypothetical protein
MIPAMPRRRPPRVLAAASAVLLAAVVGLWVRSYWRIDTLAWTDWNPDAGAGQVAYYHEVSSQFGRLVVRRDRFVIGGFLGAVNGATSVTVGRGRGSATSILMWRYADARVALGPLRYYTTGNDRSACFDVAYWLVAAAAGSPLAWAALARRSPPPGHCRRCGYDLTGNASGVCPECGAVAAPATEPGP